MQKGRIEWTVGTFVALCICYYLCRYTFLSSHGMKEWPFNLFIFGILNIAIHFIFDARKAMFCTVLGFMFGFIIGWLFNVDGFDEGGGRINNYWILWTITFLIFILLGLFWEIGNRIMKRYRSRHQRY